MTLIVGVICPEGIVLAGDSKSTIEKEVTDPQTGEKRIEQSGFVTTSDKILLTDNNVAIAVQGIAIIKDVKADAYLKDFIKDHPGLNTQDMASAIQGMLKAELVQYEMQIYVAGFVNEGGKLVPKIYQIFSAPQWRVREHDKYEAYWIGEVDIMDRLFDRVLVKKDAVGNVCEVPFHLFPFSAFNLQDAIDFAVLGVEMTYRVMRFQDRPQTVGPPIDVLAITKDGAKWYQKKDIQV